MVTQYIFMVLFNNDYNYASIIISDQDKCLSILFNVARIIRKLKFVKSFKINNHSKSLV